MSEETVEQMLSALAAADDRVATARGDLKQAESEYQAVEDRLFAYMDEQGTDSVRSKKAGLTAAIQESEVYTFEDNDKFVQFVLRHKTLEVFQRRLSAPAIRDLIERRGGKPIPGIGTYTKRRLSVTKVK